MTTEAEATSIDARRDARRRARRRVAIAVVAALVGTLAVTVALMEPAIRHCNTTIVGAPGDATAGGVWTAWNYEKLGQGPWPSKTPYTAAPEGEAFWQPQFLTAVVLLTPLWALTHVTTPTCAWNLSVLAGFVLSGLAMLALAYWLTRNPWAAALAAFAYAAAPYRQYKAEGHLAYVHGELVPLLLLALLALWHRPSWKRAAVVGVALATMAYTDGYYILLGWATFGCFSAGALVHRVRRPVVAATAGRMLSLTVIAALVAIVLMSPLAVALRHGGDTIGASLERPYSDLMTFAARPADYVLPARTHPVFDTVFGTWQDRRLRGSNYSEKTLYLGWTVIVLAGAFVATTLRTRRRPEPRDDPLPESGVRSPWFLLAGLGAVVVGALVLSAPPVAHVGPVGVPMPSGAIYAVVKLWRVYSRFFVVVHATVIAMAALGLAHLMWRRAARTQATLAFALMVMLAFEFLTFPPRRTYSYELMPGAYTWLQQQADVDLVAEYPLYPTESDPDHRYLTYQPVHGKRLLNARIEPSAQDQLRRSLFGLADRHTIAVLRRLGVDLVLVHRGLPQAPVGQPPAELEPVASFRYESDLRTRPDGRRLVPYEHLRPFYDIDVYRLRPGPQADVALAVEAGFYAPESEEWTSYRWMRGEARLTVRRLAGEATTATVSFTARGAFDIARQLSVVQGGRALWEGTVGSSTVVSFTAAVGRPVELRVTPGDEPVRKHQPASDDPRSLALHIHALAVEPTG